MTASQFVAGRGVKGERRPELIAGLALISVPMLLFQPSGLFNEVRQVLGLNPLFRALGFADDQNWIATSSTALNSIIALNACTTSGTIMLIYLTFLQTISKEIYEAAAIDGAGAWQAFRSITFPLLRPAHFFVATLLFIGGFQLFHQALIAVGKGGEPNNALTTIVLFIYRSAISDSEFGFAAAVGLILLVLIFTVTLIQRRVFGDAPSW